MERDIVYYYRDCAQHVNFCSGQVGSTCYIGSVVSPILKQLQLLCVPKYPSTEKTQSKPDQPKSGVYLKLILGLGCEVPT